jgi:putative Holliday junction resolvase
MRILALDWGTVRIGGAISDPEGRMAFPLQKYIESNNAVTEIKQIVSESAVEKIIIGLPRGMGGQDTESTEKAKKFIERIVAEISLPVETVDERLSSVGAGRVLSGMGINEKNQRDIKDNMAAQMMLEQYLNQKQN